MISNTPPKAGWALIGIFVILVVGVLTVAQSLFIPLALAVVLTLVLSPLRRSLETFGLPSGGAAGLLVGALLVLISVTLLFVGQSLQQRITDAPNLIPDAIERFQILAGYVEPVVEATEEIEEIASPDSSRMEVVVREPGLTPLIAEATPLLLGQTLLSLALLFFLLASGDMFHEKMITAIPRLGDKQRALKAVSGVERQLSAYLSTITFINAGLGVAVGLVTWALGLPDPVLFGLAAFALNYIPYLGALIGVGAAFIVGLLTFDTILQALWPALAYWFLTSLEGQFLTPALIGRRLKLNAVAVFLALAFWAWVWGVVGMFLSTPLLILVKTIADNVPRFRPLGDFIAERRAAKRGDRELIKEHLADPPAEAPLP